MADVCVKAARAQENYHLKAFEELGGKARVKTFTVPPEALTTFIDDFYAALEDAGLIGGSGTEITYPGPGDFDESGVTEKKPSGPDAACIPSATPTAGDDGGSDDEDDEDEATPTS